MGSNLRGAKAGTAAGRLEQCWCDWRGRQPM